jgi:hypothetical protein
MGRGRFRLGWRRLLFIRRRLGMKFNVVCRQDELKGIKE